MSEHRDGGEHSDRDYSEVAMADCVSALSLIPEDFPNYAEFDVSLPAGHWREIAARIAALEAENDRLRDLDTAWLNAEAKIEGLERERDEALMIGEGHSSLKDLVAAHLELSHVAQVQREALAAVWPLWNQVSEEDKVRRAWLVTVRVDTNVLRSVGLALRAAGPEQPDHAPVAPSVQEGGA